MFKDPYTFFIVKKYIELPDALVSFEEQSLFEAIRIRGGCFLGSIYNMSSDSHERVHTIIESLVRKGFLKVGENND